MARYWIIISVPGQVSADHIPMYVGILLQEELSPVIWPKPSQLLIRRQCHQAVGGGTGKMIGWRENFRHIAHSLFVTLKLMNKISLPTAAEEKDDWRLPGAPSVVL